MVAKGNEIRQVSGVGYVTETISNFKLQRDNIIKSLENRKSELETQLARMLSGQVGCNISIFS